MINRKKTTRLFLVVASTAISVGAMASTLPQTTLDTCKSYITNPTPEFAKKNAQALKQCYEHNACQDQLADITGCADTLESWDLHYSSHSADAATSKPVEAPAAAPAPTEIPALFHSTSPATPAQSTQSTQETVTTPSTPQPAPTQEEQPTQQNEKKPS